jgi:hypothetical protein
MLIKSQELAALASVPAVVAAAVNAAAAAVPVPAPAGPFGACVSVAAA